LKKLILLTGLPRSGSTWVANTIGKSPSLNYISGEPLNPPFAELSFGLNLTDWYKYINDMQSEEFFNNLLNAFCLKWDGQDTKRRLNLLIKNNSLNYKLYLRLIKHYYFYYNSKINFIKDPALFFSAENLYQSLNCSIIILHRHPAAFIASMIRMNWDFDFGVFLKQKDLLNDYLLQFENEIRFASLNVSQKGYLDRLILLWRIFNHQISLWKKKYSNQWIFILHENISINPMFEFQNIYKNLEIKLPTHFKVLFGSGNEKFSGEAKFDQVHDLLRNSKEVVNLWKTRLTPDQIKKIQEQTSKESQDMYPEFTKEKLF
jgi:hypothetical protein